MNIQNKQIKRPLLFNPYPVPCLFPSAELAMHSFRFVPQWTSIPLTVTLGDSVPGSLFFFFLHELTAADGASHSEYGDQYVQDCIVTLSI